MSSYKQLESDIISRCIPNSLPGLTNISLKGIVDLLNTAHNQRTLPLNCPSDQNPNGVVCNNHTWPWPTISSIQQLKNYLNSYLTPLSCNSQQFISTCFCNSRCTCDTYVNCSTNSCACNVRCSCNNVSTYDNSYTQSCSTYCLQCDCVARCICDNDNCTFVCKPRCNCNGGNCLCNTRCNCNYNCTCNQVCSCNSVCTCHSYNCTTYSAPCDCRERCTCNAVCTCQNTNCTCNLRCNCNTRTYYTF